jgi:alkanesulfonate monooxygenase SsuD/methylene tetrahydromethanopterin reductase-like flavin-dependent oxidoreductase (luciferase family)
MNHGIWLVATEDVDTGTLVDLGVEAEAAGWDGVFVSDQLEADLYPDPWTVLGGIAAGTSEVTLGTWVVPVPRYEPWQLANTAATLDRLADGRLMLGTGLGNDVDYEPYGRDYDPSAFARQLDESLEVMTEFWTGEPVTYEGEHVVLDEAEVHPTPVQEPRIPILSGAWWPNKKPFHRGARWDGIMPYYASLTGEDAGPHGEEPTGSPMEEVKASLEYYADVADDPGEVVLPEIPGADPSPAALADLGVTWQLTNGTGPEIVRAGPPS